MAGYVEQESDIAKVAIRLALELGIEDAQVVTAITDACVEAFMIGAAYGANIAINAIELQMATKH